MGSEMCIRDRLVSFPTPDDLHGAPMMPLLEEGDGHDGVCDERQLRLAPRFQLLGVPRRLSADIFGGDDGNLQDDKECDGNSASIIARSYPVLFCRRPSDDAELHIVETMTVAHGAVDSRATTTTTATTCWAKHDRLDTTTTEERAAQPDPDTVLRMRRQNTFAGTTAMVPSHPVMQPVTKTLSPAY